MSEQAPSHIKFVVGKWPNDIGNQPNTGYLLRNDWDDFGFKTLFHFHFVDQNGKKQEIGGIRITSKGLKGGFVALPDSPFVRLPDNYCSLGHGQDYYEELMGLSEQDRQAILIGLRDCVSHQEIFKEFEEEPSVGTSLLRNVSVSNVTILFPSILAGKAVLTDYQFLYEVNNDDSTKLEFKVTPNSNPPSNIHVLIGRNAVGKTRILSGLADSITGNENPHPISQTGRVIFDDDSFLEKKHFTNLITVVFSAFDHFKPITDESKIRSEYIGLKKDDGQSFKSPAELKEEFSKSIEKCLNSQRKKRWVDAIEILSSDPIFREYQLENFADKNPSSEELEKILKELEKIFDLLSSGHKIVLLTVTRLVELVDEKTLVLIDELENHLHPPLLSSFIRAISNLLINRNAVAIIATHSPVILQEVPKSCVTKIERVHSQYSFYRPSLETYGENIGTLTREVFGLEVMESGFYKTINDFLDKTADFDELMNKFDNEIGSEAKAIARSIIATKKDDDA